MIDSALGQVRALGGPLPAVPGYVVDRAVRRGGQGSVYHGYQATTGQEVAIKVLHDAAPGERARQRFEREVAVLARLRHKSLVAIHDCGQHEGRAYYVMEYVAGRDLDEELRAQPRSLRQRVELLARVCEAVGAAHVRGVLHRDLKPSNIRIDAEGEPRLLDFGLARFLADDAREVTGAGEFLGSVPWASPEQVEGLPLDARSDVYSLGVVLYQALTGAFPYEVHRSLARAFEAIRRDEPVPPRARQPALDTDLATILLTALAKAPERRYQSALDLARDLRRWLSGQPIEARRGRAFYVLTKTLRRHWLASLLVASVFAVVVGAVLAVIDSRSRWRAAAQRLDARLRAERLRDVGAALERGDEAAAAVLLAAMPTDRTDWVVQCLRRPLDDRRWRFAPSNESVLCAAFAPDAASVALGTFEGTLALVAAADGSALWIDRTRMVEVRAVAFSPLGDEIYALAGDEVVAFAADGARVLRTYSWPRGLLESLSVSTEHVLVASQAGEVVLFARASGAIVSTLDLGGVASPDSRSPLVLTAVHAPALLVASIGRGHLHVWDARDGASLVNLAVEADLLPTALTFAPDGTRLALGIAGSVTAAASLLVIEARSGARLASIENLAQSPQALLLIDESACWVGTADGAARRVDLAGGRTLQVVPGCGPTVRSMSWSALAAQFVVVAEVATAWRVECDTRAPEVAVPLAVSFDAVGRWVVTGEDAAGRLVVAGLGADVPILLAGAPRARAAAIGDDGRTVVACGLDGSVWRARLPSGAGQRWDLGLSLREVVADGDEVLVLTGDGVVLGLSGAQPHWQQTAVGVPGSTAIAVAGDRVAIADANRVTLMSRDGRERAVITVPAPLRVTALAFVTGPFVTGEGLLAAGTSSGQVWLLDLAHGEAMCALASMGAAVQALAYDGDRGALAVLARDGRIRLHRPPPG